MKNKKITPKKLPQPRKEVKLTAICNSLDCQNDLAADPNPDNQWEGYCSICHDSMKPDPKDTL